MDRLVEDVGLDLAGGGAIDRVCDVVDEFAQARLVVVGDSLARRLVFGLDAHRNDANAAAAGAS